MKSYLKILLALLLVLTCMFVCASCGGGSGDGGNGDGTGVTPPPAEEEETYLVDFIYRYTVTYLNDNGRKCTDDVDAYVSTLEIPVTNSGFTDELKAQIEALTYNGYTFLEWYTEWDSATNEVKGTAFDFDSATGAIEGDLVFYAYRGTLAGPSSNWAITEEGEGKDKKVILNITGTGNMFDFANANDVDVPWLGFANKITDVVIADGITSIGSNAFNGCKALKNLTIPDSITAIGANAFNGCKSLKSFVAPKNLASIGLNGLANTGLTSVVLNEGLTTIGDGAFYASNKIKTIIIPASLSSVGTSAFHPGEGASHALSKVYSLGTAEQFANMFVGIDNSAFNEAANVYYYTEDDTKVGAYWHYAKDAEGNVSTSPVQNCYTISYKLGAQYGITTPIWTDYVIVSPVLDENGDIVYNEEDNLPVLEGKITQANVDFTKQKKYHGFEFVGFDTEFKVGDVVNGDKSVTCNNYTKTGDISEGILSNDGGVVWSYNKSTKTLTVSANKSIVVQDGRNPYRIWDFETSEDTANLWGAANASAKDITTLVIGDGIEYIGKFAFVNMTSLETVVIPDSVKGIHRFAFSGCSALRGIYYDGTDLAACNVYSAPETVAGTLVDNGIGAALATVYGYTAEAVAADGRYWMTDGEATIAWSLSNGGKDLVVGGDSVMMNFDDENPAPWSGAKATIESIGFVNNITAIGQNVANGYASLATIDIPNKVTIIPENAFAGTKIVNDTASYKDGMLIVDSCLIKVLDGIKFVEIPLGTRAVAGGAFDACSTIESLFVPATVRYIYPTAFADYAPSLIYYGATYNHPVEADYATPEEYAAAIDKAVAEVTGLWNLVASELTFAKQPVIAFNVTADTAADATLTEAASWWFKNASGEYEIVGCIHEWTEWEIVTPATCTTDGLRKHSCTATGDKACGQTDVEEVIPAFGHTWTRWQNCPDEKGFEHRFCLTCNPDKLTDGLTEDQGYHKRQKVLDGPIGDSMNFNGWTDLATLVEQGIVTKSEDLAVDTAYTADGKGYAIIVTTEDNRYIELGRGTGADAAELAIIGSTDADFINATKYTIEFKINISEAVAAAGNDTDLAPVYVQLSNDQTDDVFATITFVDNGKGGYRIKDNTSMTSFKAGEWATVTAIFELEHGTTAVYINGTFAGASETKFTGATPADCNIVTFGTADKTKYDSVRFAIDDLSMTPWQATKLDFSDASNKTGLGGDPIYTITDGALVVKPAAWKNIILRRPDFNGEAVYAPGTTYVIEFDLTYTGAEVGSVTDTSGAGFFGFYSADVKGNENMFANNYLKVTTTDADGSGFYDALTWGGITFPEGVKTNVRLTYTVGTKVGTGAQDIVFAALVNGEEETTLTLLNGKAGKDLPDTNLMGFGIYWRSEVRYGKGTTLAFDNVSMSVLQPGEGGNLPAPAVETLVTLDAQGGECAKSAMTIFSGDSYVLPVPTKADHTFLGWYDADGNKVENEGETWAYNTDSTLTAKWIYNKVTITLDVAGGYLDSETYVATYGEAFEIPTPIRAGYTFMGWFENGVLVENTSGTWDNYDDHSYVAKWQINSTKLTLDAGAATLTTNEIIVKTDDGFKYELPTPTLENHRFEGWYYGDIKLDIEGVWTYDVAEATITAKFFKEACTATLDANGGTCDATATLKYGETYTLPTPTNGDLVFAGWYDGYKVFPSTGTWLGMDDVTLTAKWATSYEGGFTDFENGELPAWITGGGIAVENGALQVAYNSKGIQFKPVSETLDVAVGTKYIFQMDFTFNNVDQASDNNLAFIGFSHTNATWQSDTHKWSYLAGNNVADAVYMYGNKIAKGETVTIRFEFTVTGEGTGDIAVYINGVLGSNTTGGVISGKDTSDWVQFNIQWRGAANNRNLSCTIDNVLVGVEGPAAE